MSKPKPLTNLDADQSADLLRLMYESRTPFVFSKYGDGALECVYRLSTSMTCDREVYTDALAERISSSWREVCRSHIQGKGSARNLFVADWFSADFDEKLTGLYPNEYVRFMEPVRQTAIFVNYEALLIDRASESLLSFYRSIRKDDRKKVIIGPEGWSGVQGMLNAWTHIGIPMKPDLLQECGEWLALELRRAHPDVILYGAGMAGAAIVAEYLSVNPQATCINLGSALDPLFMGKRTRKRQLSPEAARRLFAEML